MIRAAVAVGLGSVFALSACTVAPPEGPSVMALPGQGKSFEAFQQDDVACRRYALQQTGGESPTQAANGSALGSAAVGTAVGAGLGAILGSLAGGFGTGAAIGGAAGLLGGSAIGAGNAQTASGNAQSNYDIAYTQCMYAKGDSIQPAPSGYAGYPPAVSYGSTMFMGVGSGYGPGGW